MAHSASPTPLLLEIPTVWTHIHPVRELIAQELASQPEELRGAAMMTASELVENAIKYGEGSEGNQPILFSFEMSETRLRITVTNVVASSALADELAVHVERIARAESRESRQALFVARVQAMLDDSRNRGKLGLYRIGFEGRFDLQCTYAENRVTVIAERRIS